jgi:hypothetical protein
MEIVQQPAVEASSLESSLERGKRFGLERHL